MQFMLKEYYGYAGLSCIKMLQHFSEWGKPMKLSGSDVIKVGMTALEVLVCYEVGKL
jgi:hypothetical protein